MSIQYQVVWGLLVCEISVFIFLILPFPLRWKSQSLQWMSRNSYLSNIWYALRVLFVLVLLLFVDSSTRTLQIASQKSVVNELLKSGEIFIKDSQGDAQLNLKMFYAQRNMYLTGFTLFLAIVLNRFIKVTLEKMELTDCNSRLSLELDELKENSKYLIEKASRETIEGGSSSGEIGMSSIQPGDIQKDYKGAVSKQNDGLKYRTVKSKTDNDNHSDSDSDSSSGSRLSPYNNAYSRLVDKKEIDQLIPNEQSKLRPYYKDY